MTSTSYDQNLLFVRRTDVKIRIWREAALAILSVLFLTVFWCMDVNAAVYTTEWIGSEETLYELAWVQRNGRNASGNPYRFTFHHHTRIDGSVRTPVFCLEYYRSGPDNDSSFVEYPLRDQVTDEHVWRGFAEIVRLGYPNVTRPFGTQTDAEAYYATAAAVHIWSIYYHVDVEGEERLGWFSRKDGFSMSEQDLIRYRDSFTTAHTTSGTHILDTCDNHASRRTWWAAMQLLIEAVRPDQQGTSLVMQPSGEVRSENGYFIMPFTLWTTGMEKWDVKLSETVPGAVFSTAFGTDQQKQIELKIPITRENSERTFSIIGTAYGRGWASNQNYYVSVPSKNAPQKMLYLDLHTVSVSDTQTIQMKTGAYEQQIIYDLNYSGKNYIRGSDGASDHPRDFMGQLVFASRHPSYVLSFTDEKNRAGKRSLKVTASENGVYGKVEGTIRTDLPGRTEDGYADRSDRLILSGYIYTDQTDVSVRWRFGFQGNYAAERTVYAGRWTYFEIPISKDGTMGSDLHFSFSTPGIFYFSQLMLRQDGTSGIYAAEAAPRAAPLQTSHVLGGVLGKLYGGQQPIRQGYHFLGWNTKNDGSGSYVEESTLSVSGKRVVYAIWEKEPTVEVRYHYKTCQNAQLLTPDHMTVDEWSGVYTIRVNRYSKVDLSYAAVAQGWEFRGWTTEKLSDGITEELLTEKVLRELTADVQVIDLYANFSKDIVVSYHYFDADSKTEQILKSGAQTAYNGEDFVGIFRTPVYSDTADDDGLTIPTVKDYQLSGWYTGRELDGIRYNAGIRLMSENNLDLYAGYQKKITVEFFDMPGFGVHSAGGKLHVKREPIAKLRCDGSAEPAVLRIPDQVCTPQGWAFRGYAISDRADAECSVFPEQLGTLLEVDEDTKFYASYKKTLTAVFVDYSADQQNSHEEYRVQADMLCSVDGEQNIPMVRTPFSCNRDLEWTFRGWSKHDSADASDLFAEDSWYPLEQNAHFFGSYQKNIQINFVEAVALENCLPESGAQKQDEQYQSLTVEKAQMSGLVSACSICKRTVYRSHTGEVLPVSIDVPTPKQLDFNHHLWEPRGWSVENAAKANVQYVGGETISVTESATFYASYKREVALSLLDHHQSGGHEHERVVNTIYIGTDGVLHKASFTLPSGCAQEDWKFAGWRTKDVKELAWKEFPSFYHLKEGDTIWLSDSETLYGDLVSVIQASFMDYHGTKKRTRTRRAFAFCDHNGVKDFPCITVFEAGAYDGFLTTGYWSDSLERKASVYAGDELLLTEDRVYYAIYEKPVTLTYDLNGGDGGCPDDQTRPVYAHSAGSTEGAVFQIYGEPFYAGYQFQNIWADALDQNAQLYENGTEAVLQEDTVLYAIWKAKPAAQEENERRRIRSVSEEYLHTLSEYSKWRVEDARWQQLQDSLKKTWPQGDVYKFTEEERKQYCIR